MTPRPNIRDVARVAGVSTALTSLALNDRNGVAPGTKARILAAAEQLGYRPDPHARALRTGVTNTFGLIVRNLQNPYFLDVVSGAQDAATEQDATMLVIDSDYSIERERAHIDRLATQRVDGLAIAPAGQGTAVERWFERCPDRPTVILNAVAADLRNVTRVSPDNAVAVAAAVEHLAQLGHRRISFLTAPPDLMADHDRLDTFLAVCTAVGVEPDPVETALRLEAVYDTTRALLERPPRPTAVVTNSDFTAHAVYLAARACGIEVGTELSVVGHDDLPTSQLLSPSLTTLRLDRRAVGRALFERLVVGHGLGDHHEPVELIARASTAAAPR